MGDPEKHPFEFQKNQEPLQETGSSKILVSDQERKNPSLKIIFKPKGSKTDLQKKDQNPLEVKSCIGKLKNHLPTSSLEENKEHTCEECGKSFISMKSLSGHMRTHPERHWRGIKPPPNFDSAMVKIYDQQQDSPLTSGDSEFDLLVSTRQDFDVLQFPKGWSVTGMRGRIIDELEVADSLLILSKEPSKSTLIETEIESCGIQVLKCSDPPKKRRAEGSEPGNLEFQCKKPKSDKEIENSRNGVNPYLTTVESGLEIPNGFEEIGAKNIGVDQVENTYAVYMIPRNCFSFKCENLTKKFYELGKVNYNQTPMSSNRFTCSICNKSFPSHQALGGHKSSHRNCKNSINNADLEELSSMVPIRNLTLFNASTFKKNVGTHTCKICSKTFQTGQALGGHMTEHRASPIKALLSSVSPMEKINKESSTSSVALPENVSYKTHRNLLEFDLNELPSIDDK